MLNNPVGWFEIYVQDMERAREFYEGVLSGRLEKLPVGDLEMWAFPMDPERKGSSGALVHVPGLNSGGNSTIVYFSCIDCAEEASRVEEYGGKVFKEKFSIGEFGFISLIYDTEDNMIGLHSQK